MILSFCFEQEKTEVTEKSSPFHLFKLVVRASACLNRLATNLQSYSRSAARSRWPTTPHLSSCSLSLVGRAGEGGCIAFVSRPGFFCLNRQDNPQSYKRRVLNQKDKDVSRGDAEARRKCF